MQINITGDNITCIAYWVAGGRTICVVLLRTVQRSNSDGLRCSVECWDGFCAPGSYITGKKHSSRMSPYATMYRAWNSPVAALRSRTDHPPCAQCVKNRHSQN